MPAIIKHSPKNTGVRKGKQGTYIQHIFNPYPVNVENTVSS